MQWCTKKRVIHEVGYARGHDMLWLIYHGQQEFGWTDSKVCKGWLAVHNSRQMLVIHVDFRISGMGWNCRETRPCNPDVGWCWCHAVPDLWPTSGGAFSPPWVLVSTYHILSKKMHPKLLSVSPGWGHLANLLEASSTDWRCKMIVWKVSVE